MNTGQILALLHSDLWNGKSCEDSCINKSIMRLQVLHL